MSDNQDRDAEFVRLQQAVADGIPGARDQLDAFLTDVLPEEVSEEPPSPLTVVVLDEATQEERVATTGRRWRYDPATGEPVRLPDLPPPDDV